MRYVFLFLALFSIFYSIDSYAVSISSCQSLSGSTNYTLSSDVYSNGTCFTFSANTIVLDCGGYSIIGNGTGIALDLQSYYYIDVYNCHASNFTIGYDAFNSRYLELENSSFTEVDTGLNMSYGRFNSIYNVSIIRPLNYGIYVAGSSRNNVYNYVDIVNSSDIGLYSVFYSSVSMDNDFYNLNISSSNYSIYFRQERDHNLENITLTNYVYDRGASDSAVLSYPGSYVNVSGYPLSISTNKSISLVAPLVHTFTQNLSFSGDGLDIKGIGATLDCSGYTIMGDQTGSGISIIGQEDPTYNIEVTDVTVRNCVVENFDKGVYVEGSNSLLLQDLTLRNMGTYGIHTFNENPSFIFSNININNISTSHGIYTQSLHGNPYDNGIMNRISVNNSGGDGIYVGGHGTKVYNSSTNNTGGSGIYMLRWYNSVFDSNVTNAGGYGVYGNGRGVDVIFSNIINTSLDNIRISSNGASEVYGNNLSNSSKIDYGATPGNFYLDVSSNRLGNFWRSDFTCTNLSDTVDILYEGKIYTT